MLYFYKKFIVGNHILYLGLRLPLDFARDGSRGGEPAEPPRRPATFGGEAPRNDD
jgi:hypothetical protein